jgi:hypothetical protein
MTTQDQHNTFNSAIGFNENAIKKLWKAYRLQGELLTRLEQDEKAAFLFCINTRNIDEQSLTWRNAKTTNVSKAHIKIIKMPSGYDVSLNIPLTLNKAGTIAPRYINTFQCLGSPYSILTQVVEDIHRTRSQWRLRMLLDI